MDAICGGRHAVRLVRERVKIANVGEISKSANIQWDRNNFAPRLGIAYRFREKMVFRVGYGRTYTIGQWGESLGAFSNQWPSAPFKNLAADAPYVGLSNISAGPPPINPPPPGRSDFQCFDLDAARRIWSAPLLLKAGRALSLSIKSAGRS